MENPSKQALIRAWQQRAQRISTAQQQVRQAAFHLVRLGQVGTEAALVTSTGMPPPAVQAALTALLAQGLLAYDPTWGGVVAAYGLSLVPTDHALRLDGRELFTWCALDAVGIPAGLGAEATVNSHCFTCHQPLALTCTAGMVLPTSGRAPLLWITAPAVGQSLRGST